MYSICKSLCNNIYFFPISWSYNDDNDNDDDDHSDNDDDDDDDDDDDNEDDEEEEEKEEEKDNDYNDGDVDKTGNEGECFPPAGSLNGQCLPDNDHDDHDHITELMFWSKLRKVDIVKFGLYCEI